MQIETVKIKATGPRGWAIINAEDFVVGVHHLYEEPQKALSEPVVASAVSSVDTSKETKKASGAASGRAGGAFASKLKK